MWFGTHLLSWGVLQVFSCLNSGSFSVWPNVPCGWGAAGEGEKVYTSVPRWKISEKCQVPKWSKLTHLNKGIHASSQHENDFFQPLNLIASPMLQLLVCYFLQMDWTLTTKSLVRPQSDEITSPDKCFFMCYQVILEITARLCRPGWFPECPESVLPYRVSEICKNTNIQWFRGKLSATDLSHLLPPLCSSSVRRSRVPPQRYPPGSGPCSIPALLVK